MKIRSPIQRKKARLEIIPLIDIMFFLLACFMLVSLSMIHMRGVKINLPTAVSGVPETKADFVTVSIDALGGIYLEKEKVDPDQLYEKVGALYAADKDVRIYIRGDKDALHGEVVTVLDKIRAAGPQKVAIEIKAESVPPPGAAPSPAQTPQPSPP